MASSVSSVERRSGLRREYREPAQVEASTSKARRFCPAADQRSGLARSPELKPLSIAGGFS